MYDEKFLVPCKTQLAGGILLKMLKYFEVALNILNPPAGNKYETLIGVCQ